MAEDKAKKVPLEVSMMNRIGELKAENARLKAEVERWKEASENYRLMLQDRQAHLDAERKYVERLTKVGDVMADFISPNPTAEMWGEEQAIKQAWENAKGVQS
jgi:hypothetical protein